MEVNLNKDGFYQVPADNLKQVVVIKGVEYYLTPASQLKILLDGKVDNEADIKELRDCIISVLKILGLTDETGGIKAEIRSGDEGYFGNILKALTHIVFLLGKAQIPVIGKKAEMELIDTFSFIKKVLPLIDKHVR